MTGKPETDGTARIALRLRVIPWTLLIVTIAGWVAATPHPLMRPDYSTVLFSHDGTLLSARLSDDGQWRFPAGTAELPDKYVAALLAFEDRRFYAHGGVDLLAIGRALRENRAAGEVVSGGSTLTMQLARIAMGNRQRTYAQKVREAILSLRLELRYSKDEILSLFAANAPFGGNVVGIEAAAWRYFGRPVTSLSWCEAALLAVLPNAPSLMHLGSGRDQLQEKRDRLLLRLEELGHLGTADRLLAVQEPIPERPKPVPQLALHLMGSLTERHGDTHRFQTTIDPFLQRRATELINQSGSALRQVGVSHAAALVVHVPSGAVLAYVGNLTPGSPARHGDFVDIVRAPRSTGSLLKPFLYAAMVDAGELLPRQIVADVPTRIGGYIPENHTGVFTGAVRADVALAESLNVPAARLLQQYGVSRFYSLLKELGMQSLFRTADDYGIPLILGGAESTLWELTGMYASLGRGVTASSQASVIHPPFVMAGTEPTGRSSPLSAASSFLALEALREVERPSTTIGWQHFASAGAISWKTGTSYGLRDAWAIGVSEEYAVGVWVGNASGRGAPGLRGSSTAGPMLFRLFELLGPPSGFASPGGMQLVELCGDSGFAAGPDCAERVTGYLPRGVHDPRVCPYCRTLHLDSAGANQVTASIYPLEQMQHVKRFVLPGTMAYYAARRALAYEPPPPLHPDLRAPQRSLSLAFPLPDAQIYIPVEMDGARGSFVAQAHHSDRSARLFWHLDGRYHGETQGSHAFEFSPPPGMHTLTVLSEGGERVAVDFEVLRDEQ